MDGELQVTNPDPSLSSELQLFDGNLRMTDNDLKLINGSCIFRRQSILNPNSVLVCHTELESFIADENCFLKKEKDELAKYIQVLQLKIKNLRDIKVKIKTTVRSQRLERVFFQKKLAEIEKDGEQLLSTKGMLEETIAALSEALEYLSVAFNQLKNVAAETCRENCLLKHEIKTVEEFLTLCKETAQELKKDKVLKYELLHVWTKYAIFEDLYQDLSKEIMLVKDDSEKQLHNISEVLASFENVALHFSKMKEVFLEQQKTVNSYKIEAESKMVKEGCQDSNRRSELTQFYQETTMR